MIYTSAKALDTLIREIGESTTDCTIKSDKKQKPNYSRDEISKRLEFARCGKDVVRLNILSKAAIMIIVYNLEKMESEYDTAGF